MSGMSTASTGCGESLLKGSGPQALKRGQIFSDLTARLKSCPSHNPSEAEFFLRLFKPCQQTLNKRAASGAEVSLFIRTKISRNF